MCMPLSLILPIFGILTASPAILLCYVLIHIYCSISQNAWCLQFSSGPVDENVIYEMTGCFCRQWQSSIQHGIRRALLMRRLIRQHVTILLSFFLERFYAVFLYRQLLWLLLNLEQHLTPVEILMRLWLFHKTWYRLDTNPVINKYYWQYLF